MVHVGSPSVQSVELDNLVEDTQQHARNVSYDHPYPYTSQLLQFDNLLEGTQQHTYVTLVVRTSLTYLELITEFLIRATCI